MSRKTLTQCLEVFNRKERYWLIRNCCGNGDDLALPLNDGFIDTLAGEFKELLSIDLKNAWWAMDYHIDWLIAALTLYQDKNTHAQEIVECKKRKQGIACNISGTQEDFDFIICADNTIILIEAKLSSGWDYDQLFHKIDRLERMHELFNNINKYFVLLSPNFSNIEQTSELVKKTLTNTKTTCYCMQTPPTTDIRAFLVKTKSNHRDNSDKARFLKVTRCNEHGTPDDKGTYWKTHTCAR
jgi:hypothetical protein